MNQTTFSLTLPSPMSATREDHTTQCPDPSAVGIREVAICIIVCVVSTFGLLGNGTVIWLLGFRLKRNPFTTYILNLAVADFGVLLLLVFTVAFTILRINPSLIWHSWFLIDVSVGLFHFAYSTSQILLTTISIDRCVSLLFPLWYRCRRPERFPAVLCALIWILSILVHGVRLILYFTVGERYFPFDQLYYVYLVNAVVCLPLITVSTLILFIRFCFKSQQRHRGKLLTVILLTLLFFLIFAFPLNAINLIVFNHRASPEDYSNVICYGAIYYGWLCASLNSFVNPLLYFLIGTKKRGLCGVLKLVLQRVFIEEEEARRGEPGTQS